PVANGETGQVTTDRTPKKVVVKPIEKPIEKPVEPAPAPADPGRMQKYAAYGAVGVGGIAIVVSSVMTLSARSKYKDALSNHCMGSTSMCDMQGLTDTHDARHSANVATVVFLLGAAAVGGGVALYLMAPHATPASDEH